MVEVELANRSGVEVEADVAITLAQHVLAAEGVESGSSGSCSSTRTRCGS